MSKITKIPKTLLKIQSDLKNNKYTLVNLVDYYLNNINKNKNLNAFITITDDYAYEYAKKLDEQIKNNPKVFENYPLIGAIVSFKDLFLTKNIRTTAGSKILENYIPQYSSTTFNRVEEAGGILIGKTNLDAFAHGASGENSDFGPTKNPHNVDYVPGGSSSGSAVSVAANMSLISFGTDTGGSIRLPASFCGVVGLKPTFGAVSRYGIIAMSSSMDSVGHFANSVEDTEKVFNITKGPDNFDSTLTSKKLSIINHPLSIGIPREYFTNGLDPAVKKATEKVIDFYKKAGHKVIDVSLPHTKYAIAVYYIIMPAEVSSNLGRFDGIRYGNKRDSFGDEAKRRIMLGAHVLSLGYYDAFYDKAMRVRTKIINDFDKVYKKVDCLLAPVSPTLPFKIGEKSNDPLQMYLSDIYTASVNLAGLPALAIPTSESENNLPIGFQLIANKFEENTLFTLGKKYDNRSKK